MRRATAPTLDPTRLVFLDESGVGTDLVRRYVRGRRGERAPDHAPDGRWYSTTFLAAIRVTGVTAPAVFDGLIDGPSFRPYVEQALVPTLRQGEIVVMDILACHKVRGIADGNAGAGAALWCLPPYSPNFNPIELSFAKLKTILRAARCRTVTHLWTTIGAALARCEPKECRNYSRHCGYAAATDSWNPL